MTQNAAAELKARLVSFAKDVGFDSCRVAVCKRPAHTNRVSRMVTPRGSRRNELHATRRRETLRSQEDPSGCAIDRCSGVELFSRSELSAVADRCYRTRRTLRMGRRLSRANREQSWTGSTSFFGVLVDNKNVMSTRGRFWSAITAPNPALDGMAKAPCSSINSLGRGSFSQKS